MDVEIIDSGARVIVDRAEWDKTRGLFSELWDAHMFVRRALDYLNSLDEVPLELKMEMDHMVAHLAMRDGQAPD